MPAMSAGSDPDTTVRKRFCRAVFETLLASAADEESTSQCREWTRQDNRSIAGSEGRLVPRA